MSERDIPTRSHAGDVASLFVFFVFGALALQFLGRITEFALLRSDGVQIEGRWIDRYHDPKTREYIAIYTFEIDNQQYQGRQTVTEANYGGDGQPVSILYLSDDPGQNRVQGTEQIVVTDVLFFILTTMVVVFAGQYIFAYYTERTAWVLLIWRKARIITGAAPD